MSRTHEKLAPDLFSVGPGARTTDPETSHQTASRNRSNRRTVRKQALLALANAPSGLTDFELGDAIGRQQTSAGKRRGELRDAGLVFATQDHRPAPSGSPAIVWKLTDAGIKAAAELVP
jgi:hypothetical protein